MTKSEIFKAAHKLAKAYKMQCGGDYVVYLSIALKNLNNAVKKGFEDKDIFKAMNAKITKVSSELELITHKVKVSLTHGRKEFAKMHQLENAKRDLEAGHFFGKTFESNGMICAWERSTVTVNEAY